MKFEIEKIKKNLFLCKKKSRGRLAPCGKGKERHVSTSLLIHKYVVELRLSQSVLDLERCGTFWRE